MIKARGKRTVHFHRLPRDFFFQHLRTFPVRCMVARSQGGGRGGAGREDEQDDGRPSNEDIASRCCLVCARCLRGQVRKRGHSRISRRDPPIPLLYILIGTIERLSRDNGQDYAQESVSSVHVGVTRAIRHLSRCVHHARSQHRLDSIGYGIAAYGGKGISAAPSVNCRRSCHASVTSRHTYEPSTPLPFLARASFVRETRPSHDGVTRNIRSRTNVPFFFSLSLSLVFVINKRKIASRRFKIYHWTSNFSSFLFASNPLVSYSSFLPQEKSVRIEGKKKKEFEDGIYDTPISRLSNSESTSSRFERYYRG